MEMGVSGISDDSRWYARTGDVILPLYPVSNPAEPHDLLT